MDIDRNIDRVVIGHRDFEVASEDVGRHRRDLGTDPPKLQESKDDLRARWCVVPYPGGATAIPHSDASDGAMNVACDRITESMQGTWSSHGVSPTGFIDFRQTIKLKPAEAQRQLVRNHPCAGRDDLSIHQRADEERMGMMLQVVEQVVCICVPRQPHRLLRRFHPPLAVCNQQFRDVCFVIGEGHECSPASFRDEQKISLYLPHTSNVAGDSSSALTELRYRAAIAPSMMR